MLSKEQENWLMHLSDTDEVKVVPYDPKCEEIFAELKEIIQAKLGMNIKVEHHGASSMGISGQDEIDVYILVSPAEFNVTVHQVGILFGEPKSLGQEKRARFRTELKGKKIDLFVSNKEHEEWKRHLRFKTSLMENPDALEQYRKIKENASGKSTREYYRDKIEFINKIISD